MRKTKNLLLVILFLVVLLVSGCTKTETIKTTTIDYSGIEETPDSYVDRLPDSMEDGVILQAFSWKFEDVTNLLPEIKDAGFKMVQLSPVQQPKGGGSTWWSYYQPVSFSIGESALGNKETLTTLCTEAEKYGIKIIVDTVFNHLANISDSDLEPDGTPKVSPEVEKYEPEIYAHRNDSGSSQTFHHNKSASGSGAVTQYYAYGQLPDLNTSNPLVQERALAFLKECIDVGVDGFRFDAAKHIETPDDPQYPSDFWPNTLGVAKEYYKEKTGDDLFAYGEILGDPDGGRNISCYTKLMSVTETSYTDGVKAGLVKSDAAKVKAAKYGKSSSNEKDLIVWAESHDTYTEALGYGNTTGPKRLTQMYAVIASRKNTNPIYLARCDEGLSVATVASYMFCEERTAVLNRFHNRFIGSDENQIADDKLYICERFDDNQKGAVIVTGDFTLCGTKVTVHFENMGTGCYYDQLTGEKVYIKNNIGEVTIDSNGIAVITQTKDNVYPEVAFSLRSGSFIGSLDISLIKTNVSKGTYKINGGSEIALGDSIKLTSSSNGKLNILVHVESKEGKIKEMNLVFTSLSLLPGQDGKFQVLGINPKYLTDYEIYLWCWGSSSSRWQKNYEIVDGVLLVDFNNSGYTNFLIGLFEKGHTIGNPASWDSSCIKQTKDIAIKDGWFDLGDW